MGEQIPLKVGGIQAHGAHLLHLRRVFMDAQAARGDFKAAKEQVEASGFARMFSSSMA